VGELIVEPDAIRFDGQVFARDSQYLFRDSVEPAACAAFAALAPDEQRRRLGVFQSALLEHAALLSMAVVLDPARREYFEGGFAQALADRFLEGAAALSQGAYADAAALLQGVGYGLTPSGDDFLCGAILAQHYDQDAARSAPAAEASDLAEQLAGDLSRSAFMSRTFLRDAIAGRWSKRLRDAAESLCDPDATRCAQSERAERASVPRGHGATRSALRERAEQGPEARDSAVDDAIRQAVIRALDHGATSGADLLSGFLYMALHCFADTHILECA
jgi:hypothetical protein